jgi:hypothetical protein
VVNTPERVEVSNKTIRVLFVMKWGRDATIKKENASNKHPKKEKTRSLQKTVNVSQTMVDRHLVNVSIPQSSTQVCYINEIART